MRQTVPAVPYRYRYAVQEKAEERYTDERKTNDLRLLRPTTPVSAIAQPAIAKSISEPSAKKP